MPQTLLAFLAMMIAALATINQLTERIKSFDETLRGEYELMANALVLERMEVVDLTTDYDDLEDWDGIQQILGYDVSGNNLDFTLDYEVTYVDDNGDPSEQETNQKEVSISASNEKFAWTLVTHQRLFSD